MEQLRKITFDIEKRRVQFESSTAQVLRLSLTPEGIKWEMFQPPNIVTGGSVDKLVENGMPKIQVEPITPEIQKTIEDKEKDPILTLPGKMQGVIREGRPDSSGKKTAWGRGMFHVDGEDEAHPLSVTFHKHTALTALTLPADAQLTVQGYLRKNTQPGRSDYFSVFHLINYPGKD